MGHPGKALAWLVGFLLVYAAAIGSIATGALGFVWPLFGMLVCLRLAAIVHTIFIPVPTPAPRSLMLGLAVIGMYIGSLTAGLVAVQFARPYRMPTPAMYPALEVGDHFMCSLTIGELKRGQIVAFLYPRDPTKSFVQRIVGLAGDTIEIRRGELVLNGTPVNKEPLPDSCMYDACTMWQETIDGSSYKIAILDGNPFPEGREFDPVTVPDGQLFVLGDNRDNSLDSRFWGFVPVEFVQAKPQFIYWSSEDADIRWNRIGKVVR
jgi:signal peptidase I